MRKLLCPSALLLMVAFSCSKELRPLAPRIVPQFHTRIELANSDFIHDNGAAAITGTGTDRSPKALSQLVTLELKRYPGELLQRLALFEVIICENLRVNSEARLIVVNLESGTMYVDCRLILSTKELAIRLLHHEVFHLIDYRDDGTLYSDDKWLRINSKEFSYLGTEAAAAERFGKTTEPLEGVLGIISGYAAVALEEDKAELFSFMIVDLKGVERRCQQDQVLKAKTARIIEILNSFGPGIATMLLGSN